MNSIIVIPGVDDEPAEEWSKAHNTPLVRDLSRKGNPALNTEVLVLQHRITSANFKQWGQLELEARELLTIVEEFIQHWEVGLLKSDSLCPLNIDLGRSAASSIPLP